MTPALIVPISALHDQARRQLGHALRTLRARFIEAHRQRHEQRRMLLAIQQLDHPGVLADVQAARGPIAARADRR